MPTMRFCSSSTGLETPPCGCAPSVAAREGFYSLARAGSENRLGLHCVHCSGRRRKGLINSGQPLLYFEGFGMSTLDEITKEKQRLGEALARVDAQREKLSSQLSELEAAERVLARYTKGGPGRRTSSAKMPS